MSRYTQEQMDEWRKTSLKTHEQKHSNERKNR